MSYIVINVEHLGKRYRIGARPRHDSVREAIADSLRAPRIRPSPSVDRFIWALKDVSFEVRRGETVGIVGRNGAGKSTLLKILSRITEPTEGQAEIHGRVGSLLEVGTGFHPELTGRENIYLNGAILGMRKTEIDRRFDEIVAFAEIEKFLDTPVKRYSSGMYVRLAFAIAAHLEPEILLVDEVLAVGDAAFQRKCLGKMGEVAHEGRTILFVSHNMAAVQNLCERAILLDGGVVAAQGETSSVIAHYVHSILTPLITVPLKSRLDRSGRGPVRLTSFHVEDETGKATAVTQSGADTVFVFGFECQEGSLAHNVDVGFSVHRENDEGLFVLYSSYVGQSFAVVPAQGQFRCLVRELPLSAGRYRIHARVTVNGEESDWPRNGVGYLDVEAGDFYGTGSTGVGAQAPFLVKGDWQVSGVS